MQRQRPKLQVVNFALEYEVPKHFPCPAIVKLIKVSTSNYIFDAFVILLQRPFTFMSMLLNIVFALKTMTHEDKYQKIQNHLNNLFCNRMFLPVKLTSRSHQIYLEYLL